MLYNTGLVTAVDWWSLGPFRIRPYLQDSSVADANFVARTRSGASPVSAYVAGSQEMSQLKQKAISLLNANLFVCLFSPLLCVPRLHIWSYHDRLWEKRNPLFLQRWKKRSEGAGASCSSCSQAGAANPPMKQVRNLLSGCQSGTALFV